MSYMVEWHGDKHPAASVERFSGDDVQIIVSRDVIDYILMHAVTLVQRDDLRDSGSTTDAVSI
jgi:hypothetical protein